MAAAEVPEQSDLGAVMNVLVGDDSDKTMDGEVDAEVRSSSRDGMGKPSRTMGERLARS